MSEKFLINGSRPLEGTVALSGAKNDAGPILAAALLTTEACVIDNLPLVEDILNMIEYLRRIGVEIEWLGKRKLKLRAGKIDPNKIDFSLAAKMRLSVLLIGPLAARFKKFKISPPGGDKIIGMVRSKGGAKIGLRPISTHLEAMARLGVKNRRRGNTYYFDASNLHPAEVVLKEFSVTATENLMMCAAGLEGKTVIKGAAAEPHVQDLAKMLRAMGAKIEGVKTHTISIEGRQKLGGSEHRIIPEHLEAGTFFIAGAMTPGNLEIRGVVWDHLDIFLARMEEAGVSFERKGKSLLVRFSPDLVGIGLQSLPWPGFPTDLLPIVVPLLTQAKGRSLIHDPLYENRLGFLSELKKMGADVEIVDPHRAFVFGKTPLRGVAISGWDIRAGASLLVAGLAAKGKSILSNVRQIDRGYEKIDQKFKKLGADIKRITD
jgi:UDP-N-acetylglucosamine 1-carboxyvinyltransferase